MDRDRQGLDTAVLRGVNQASSFGLRLKPWGFSMTDAVDRAASPVDRASPDRTRLVRVALATLPFLGILGGASFANRAEPFVLGLPFLMAWIVLWVVASSGLLAIIYALDPVNRGPQPQDDEVSAP